MCRLWVCILHRVFGCLVSCLRWGEVVLLPFLGSLQKEPSALSLPTCQPEPRGQLGQEPLLQPPALLGRWRPPGAQSGGAGLPPGPGLHPGPGKGHRCLRGGKPRSSPRPAPGRPRPARVCVRCGVRVCVSHANPPSPNRPPQQFAIPYKFGNRFLKNSVTHNGDGAGGGQWHWGPKSPSH